MFPGGAEGGAPIFSGKHARRLIIKRMFIDRAGLPFVGAALVLALGAGLWFGRAWSVPFLVLAAFFVFFFRDPDRAIPTGDNLVLSPADARIMAAGDRTWPGAPPGDWQVVSMFLSPMDVHVNRTPVAGTVTRVEYHPGQFLPAYRKEAGQLNEWTEVWFDRPGGAIVARQIVGDAGAAHRLPVAGRRPGHGGTTVRGHEVWFSDGSVSAAFSEASREGWRQGRRR